jgi:hypothetical protein
MQLEIVKKDNATSKLTIAKDRCTVKIATTDSMIEDRIILMAGKIYAKMNPVDFTYRGQFSVLHGKICINLSTKVDSKLFVEGDFDGT